MHSAYEFVNPGKKKYAHIFIINLGPVNRMYLIKCCVNSSLHNSGCCIIMSVAPWITVLSQHTVFTKRVIYYKFTFARYFAETRHHAQTHIISGALSALSLAARRTQATEQMSWWFRWPVLAVATSAGLPAAAVVVPLIRPPKNNFPYC